MGKYPVEDYLDWVKDVDQNDSITTRREKVGHGDPLRIDFWCRFAERLIVFFCFFAALGFPQ